MTALRTPLFLLLYASLAALYVLWLQADTIGGLFGILWSDEGAYLLSAKHATIFGVAHPFAGDRYFPEYTTPLLHRLGLLVMTPENTVWGVRLTVACAVLLAQLLLARLAYRYYGDRGEARWCLLVLMLCPLLYFYARIGLSEGLQWLMLALALWGLWGLFHATRLPVALGCAVAVAVLTALLFLSKITSAAACVGLAVGVLTICFIRPRREGLRIAAVALISGVLALGAIALWFVGDAWTVWWHNNIGNHVFDENVPKTGRYLLQRLLHHYVGLHHFLTLMPVFAIGFWGLIMAADKRRGFLYLLWVVTISTLLIESLFGGELRRSFFGLGLMMLLGGFTLREWLQHGINWQRPWPRARWLSLALVGAFLLGLLGFSYEAIMASDRIYRLLGPIFLLVIVGGAWLSGQAMRRWRYVLVGLLLLTGLLPMIFQALMAPRTTQQAVAALEARVPAESRISGSVVPWYFVGLKRELLFLNCIPSGLAIANEPRDMPYQDTYFYLTFPELADAPPICLPPDFAQYAPVMEFQIFFPFNKGPGYGGSRNWLWWRPFVLYKKQLVQN